MNTYLLFIIYLFIGFFGAYCHYLKKRYVDNTLSIGLIEYIKTNKKATTKAILAIIGVEYGITLSDTVDFLSFAEVGFALTSGYTADSNLNSIKETT